METRCPFWQVCGAAMVHHYWLMQAINQRSNWIGTVCCNEAKYRDCPHYELRADPKKKEGQNEIG